MSVLLDIPALEICFREAPDLVFLCDAHTRIRYANPSSERTVRRALPELRELGAHRVFDVAFSPGLWSQCRQVLELGRTLTTTVQGLETRGWYEFRCSPIRTETETGILLVGRDVTELRGRAHDAEAQARELRVIADAIPALVWTVDTRGEISFLSRQWLEYTGLEASTGVGEAFLESVLSSDDLRVLHDAWKSCRASDEPGLFRLRVRRRDAAWRWHFAHLVPLHRSESGTVIEWLGVAIDVHGELRAKAEVEAIVAGAPIGIGVLDSSLRYRLVNNAFERVHGAKGGDFLSDGSTNSTPLLARQLEPNLRQVLNTGIPVVNVEVNAPDRRNPGDLETHLVSFSPVRLEGEIVSAAMTMLDVTEQKRMESSLRAALQRSKFHFDNSPMGVIEWDRDFRVVFWSRGAEALFGWSANEVQGKHPDEWPFVHLEDAAAVREGIAHLLSGEAPRDMAAGRYHRKDGTVVHCEWYHSALTDEVGRTVSVLSSILDVTSKVLAEGEEREQRARAELERARSEHLLTHAPALVAIMRGPDHVYEFLNERFRATFPESSRLLGASARGHRRDLVEEHFVELLDQVFNSGEPYETVEVPVSRPGKSGALETIYLTFIYQPILASDGKVEGIASFAFDVTESVLARKQVEEASRAKDEFLSTLSHELRTPLNAIVGWSHLLRTGALDEPQSARALEAIDRNARVQKRLIDDLLDFARIVSGKMGLFPAPVDMTSVVMHAVETIQPSIDAKSVGLTLRVEQRPVVLGDPDRLHQVISNLLSNAVKFTGPRGRVEVQVLSDGERMAEVTVRDDGLGIDAHFLPHVFERFRQADGSSTRMHGGLGLGLAIARSIIELHGGSIEAKSDGLGCGATMRVRIPLATGGEVVSVERAPKLPPARTRLQSVRVLVVDDEEDASALAQAALSRAGALVSCASSAAEAFEMLHRENFDVIVSDIGMPVLDGIALIARVRSLPSALSRIPAVAVTAYARNEDRDRAVGAGFDAFLSKPIDVDELVSLIASVLGRVP